MKYLKILRFPFLTPVIICLLSFVSCIPWDNHSFPSKVTFSKDGGEKVVVGVIDPSVLSIYSGNYEILAEGDLIGNDSVKVGYDWLRLKSYKNRKAIIINASPNGGNKRKLIVDLDFGQTRGEIVVVQNGK